MPSYTYHKAREDPEFNRRRYLRHKETQLKCSKEWAARNREKVRESNKKWQSNNREKAREYQRAHRARQKLLLTPPPPPPPPPPVCEPSPDAVQIKITNLFVPGSVTLGQNDFL
jgi:hypothetical protein